nr:hypothetical protein [Rathayibacter sp. AY2B9]
MTAGFRVVQGSAAPPAEGELHRGEQEEDREEDPGHARGRRKESATPAKENAVAVSPTTRPARTSSRPRRAFAIEPVTAVGIIAASEVPLARRSASPKAPTRTGTAIAPPPMPKRPEATPIPMPSPANPGHTPQPSATSPVSFEPNTAIRTAAATSSATNIQRSTPRGSRASSQDPATAPSIAAAAITAAGTQATWPARA